MGRKTLKQGKNPESGSTANEDDGDSRRVFKNLCIPQPDTRGLLLISLLSQPLGVSATSLDLWYRNNNKNDTLNENEPRKKKRKRK